MQTNLAVLRPLFFPLPLAMTLAFYGVMNTESWTPPEVAAGGWWGGMGWCPTLYWWGVGWRRGQGFGCMNGFFISVSGSVRAPNQWVWESYSHHQTKLFHTMHDNAFFWRVLSLQNWCTFLPARADFYFLLPLKLQSQEIREIWWGALWIDKDYALVIGTDLPDLYLPGIWRIQQNVTDHPLRLYSPEIVVQTK